MKQRLNVVYVFSHKQLQQESMWYHFLFILPEAMTSSYLQLFEFVVWQLPCLVHLEHFISPFVHLCTSLNPNEFHVCLHKSLGGFYWPEGLTFSIGGLNKFLSNPGYTWDLSRSWFLSSKCITSGIMKWLLSNSESKIFILKKNRKNRRSNETIHVNCFL